MTCFFQTLLKHKFCTWYMTFNLHVPKKYHRWELGSRVHVWHWIRFKIHIDFQRCLSPLSWTVNQPITLNDLLPCFELTFLRRPTRQIRIHCTWMPPWEWRCSANTISSRNDQPKDFPQFPSSTYLTQSSNQNRALTSSKLHQHQICFVEKPI